jgi:hypothetical protein
MAILAKTTFSPADGSAEAGAKVGNWSAAAKIAKTQIFTTKSQRN